MVNLRATAFHRGQHLDENELEPESDLCPVCACDGVRKPIVFLQSKPEVRFNGCSKCKAISASRMPKPSALERYYSSYYDEAAVEQVTFDKPFRLAKLLAEAYLSGSRNKAKNIRILDIGGGDGTISILCAGYLLGKKIIENADIVVVDVSRSASVFANTAINCCFVEDLERANGLFDVVVASAVLEHIPDLFTTLKTIVAKMKVGGIFYARTPYMTPFRRIGIAVDLTFPAHVHDLGAAFWAQLARKFYPYVSVLHEGPSIIETTLKEHPLRTVIAWLLKLPARFARSIGLHPVWPFYGGWQVIWRREAYHC